MNESFAVLMAAVISAFVAVVGLVITKENKIPEFRQQWIDGLRADTSSLIATVIANRIAHRGSDTYRDISLKLSELQYRIEFRFKPGDTSAEPLLAAVTELVYYGGDQNSWAYSQNEMYNLIKCVKDETQTILKHEWERVKKGEKRYCQTLFLSKVAAILTTFILVVFICILFFTKIILPSIGWMVSQFKA